MLVVFFMLNHQNMVMNDLKSEMFMCWGVEEFKQIGGCHW